MVAAKAMARCDLPFLRLPPPSDCVELLLVVDGFEEDNEPLGVTLPPVLGFLVDFLEVLFGEGVCFLAACEVEASTCLNEHLSLLQFPCW